MRSNREPRRSNSTAPQQPKPRRTQACLSLVLEPILPTRGADNEADGAFYGYCLRERGRQYSLREDDPALRWAGARFVEFQIPAARAGELQHDCFSPGRELRLVCTRESDGRRAVEVWDSDCGRCAGQLPDPHITEIFSARDSSLELRTVALDELRQGGMRTGLTLMIVPKASVSLSLKRLRSYTAPPGLPRLLLTLDEDFRATWWDPDAACGPADLAGLGVSPALRGAARDLEKAGKRLRKKRSVDADRPRHMERHAVGRLEHDARELWRLARSELGDRYAVGLITPSIKDVVWSPQQVDMVTT